MNTLFYKHVNKLFITELMDYPYLEHECTVHRG